MGINRNPVGHTDNARQIVGNQQDVLDQEPGSGKPVMRRGGPESEADIDVGTAASPIDLTGGDFESGSKNAGGAEALGGKFISDDNNTFSVEIDWLDDDGNVAITSSPASLTDVTDVEFNLVMRSDRFEVRLTDTSGGAQNNVHGTANAH